MNCPTCQHENAPDSNFCAHCGAKLPSRCPQCGGETKAEDRFCSRCGGSLTASSPLSVVPEPVTLEEQFASFQEGLPTSFREQLLAQPEGETRVVTVLFADMSSSVAATGDLHPEDAVALVNRLLRAMVDVLMKYEGRVDRFLGDGLLAVFGTPVAHESDPERAILAAIEIREAARELGLEVTAGLNTGEVYVGGIGSERHQEVTVMGPVVNLASRLQGQAQPGQILVGAPTYRQTRRAFEFSPLSLQIKGIAQPVAAYVAERALLRPEKTRGIEGLRAELIGREEDLAKIQDALAGLLQGQGQMVTLIGEAGVGKSRLVAELKAVVQPSHDREGVKPSHDREGVEGDSERTLPSPSLRGVPGRGEGRGERTLPHGCGEGTGERTLPDGRGSEQPLWLEGRCLELSMTASYWPFLDLLREHFAWSPVEDEAARAGRLVGALRELVNQGDLSGARFDEIGPLLGHLFSVRFGNEWDERLKNSGPEEIKHRTFLAIRDLFLALSRRQPLILVLEDLHWADSLSLDLISLLMETVTIAPLFLLCVYRPERAHKCWRLGTIAAQKCAERYTEISLRELSAVQSRRLIGSLLSIDNLPPAVKEAILQKSGGNPFFVEEVVRSLIASGMVYQDGDAWKAREGIEKVSVPESIQGVILSRVDRLEQNLRRVLQSAAVIGRLFRRRLLEHTTREATALERDLWELEEQALIYQERAVPEEEYSFKHVLMQETIYQNILRPRRAVFHQQVAEAIEALYQEELHGYYEQLAHHYERSGADEKAVEYLLKAGEKARRAYLNEAAIGYLQRALDRLERSGLGERQEWKLAALAGLAKTCHLVGRMEDAEALLRQAIALARKMGAPVREIVRLHYWLGEVLYWQSRYDELIALGEEGLALLGEDRESAEAALMNLSVAGGHNRKGNEEKWREFTRRNAAFVLRLPYWEECLAVYDHIVHLCADVEKDLPEAMRWVRALQQQAEEHRDLRSLCGVHDQTGWLLRNSGDFPGAIAAHQQLLELCARTGNPPLTGWALWYLVDHYLTLGNLPRAEELVPLLQENNRRFGSKPDRARSSLAIGTLRLCQGRQDEAVAALEEAAHLWREIGPPRSEARAAQALGRVYLAQGRRPEAWAQFEAALVLTGQATAERLGDLEAAADPPESFDRFCRRFRAEHPEAGASSPVQWHLEPTQPRPFPGLRAEEIRAASLSPDWVWQDPFGDCSFTVQHGLEIHAANGRDLWHVNLSAPRLLRPAAGDLAIQAVCIPVSEEKPAIGGLLLWKDKANFLRLERGTRGKHEISFQGCLGNEDVILGRGRLPSERVHLRLERVDGRVNALCSADGEEWFTVGQVEFPVEDPVEVGLHAIGSIDRAIYPGAYPEGTAIRFERFDLWG